MTVYFSGCDEFNCVLEKQETNTTRINTSKVSKVNFNFVNVACGLDLIFYQKEFKGPWFLKGYGTRKKSIEIFKSHLNVFQVSCCTSSSAYGLDEDGSVYKVDFERIINGEELENGNFEENEEPELKWTISKSYDSIGKEDKIKRIATNDSDCFAIDNSNGVYKIPDLIYRLENSTLRKIAVGFEHVLILTDAGAIYSFGSGSRGQLGHGEIILKQENPKRIEFFDDLPSVVTDIFCSGWHSLCLTSDGDAYSWGWNESNQLGYSSEKLSTVSGQPYPIDLGSSDDPIISCSVGARHSCAVLSSGKVFIWGSNKFDQLGLDLDLKFDNSTFVFNKISCPTEISYFVSRKIFINRVICGRWCTFYFSNEKE